MSFAIRVGTERTTGPVVECSWDDQTGDGQCEKRCCCLRNGHVEVLFHAVDTAEEETHSQDEEQVGQHTADQRGLHNENLIVDESEDGDDQFDGVTGGLLVLHHSEDQV